METIVDLEKMARETLRELLLKLIEEGKGDAQEIISYLRSFGFDIPQSTVYSALKDLEREGLIVGEGSRNKKYELTEKGRKLLESERKKVEGLERSLRKVRIMNAMGVKDLLKALAELLDVVEELTPEERAKVTVAVGAATTSVREALAKQI